jgi:formyl-CoA transferase
MSGALSDIKVIDVTAARAGPACVRVLADLGAEVIQVVRPASDGIDASFTSADRENLHRNKRSVAINLQTDEGRELFIHLVKDADILIENFRPDVKHRLWIDYEKISKVNPRIVYGSISGFGQDGPYGPRPGVDQIAQGLGGIMSVTGPPGSGPWRVGIAVCDMAAGMNLAQGVLGALHERERSGEGQWVHTSLLESALALLDFQAARWLISNEVAEQAGNDHATGGADRRVQDRGRHRQHRGDQRQAVPRLRYRARLAGDGGRRTLQDRPGATRSPPGGTRRLRSEDPSVHHQ